mgnify:CR=1 FL=1
MRCLSFLYFWSLELLNSWIVIASLHYKATPPKNIISKKQRIKKVGNIPTIFMRQLFFLLNPIILQEPCFA